MFQLANKTFKSRLLTGTGKFASYQQMEEALLVSGTELITVALRRVEQGADNQGMLAHLDHPHINLLPNTSGARNAEEAVFAARLGREALETDWVKMEIHPDPKYLLPDPVETLKATATLAKEGFVVLPYIHADPVLCKRLEDVGAAAVMPLGSPIGSGKGLRTIDFLKIIIDQSQVPVIVDAGIGSPSQAAQAMEAGADAVLVNTAIAAARDPLQMARAFRLAVDSGRMAYESGLVAANAAAIPTSPLTGFLNELS